MREYRLGFVGGRASSMIGETNGVAAQLNTTENARKTKQ
jgi:hypothetical protein